MSAQFDNAFNAYAQHMAQAANRANRLAMETAEGIFGVQLKTLQHNLTATTGFLGEVAHAQPHDAQALLPKGLQVACDNLERVASASQEVVGLGLKSTEALSELVRAPFSGKAS